MGHVVMFAIETSEHSSSECPSLTPVYANPCIRPAGHGQLAWLLVLHG